MTFSHAEKSRAERRFLAAAGRSWGPRRASAQWGSGLILLARKGSKAPGKFIRGSGETGFDRILSNVEAVIGKAVRVLDAMIGEAPLPDFACIAVFALHSKREAALDELHCFFEGHVGWDGEQQVNVVRQNDEVVEGESSGTNRGAENVDEQHGVALRLEQTFAHPGLSCDEEGAIDFDNVCGIGVAGECRHGWYSGAEARLHCRAGWHG
jgi:hypothetical protein